MVAVQVLSALHYLKKYHVLHRDIKLQNIMIQPLASGEALYKLGDFGLSREFSKTSDCAKTVLGTPYYMSPECFLGLPYNIKSDVYSLGVVLYYLVERRFPLRSENVQKQKELVISGEIPFPLNVDYSQELKEVIMTMLAKQQAQRPFPENLLKLPIFEN